MNDVFIFLENTFTQSVIIGTPILLAAVGEIVSERSGILNLGLEGLILLGAAFGFLGSWKTGNPWIGLSLAIIICIAANLIHAFISITMKSNQIVSGLALTLFGGGASSLIGSHFNLMDYRCVRFEAIPIPLLNKIPFLGHIFFSHNIMVYLSVLIAIGTAILISKTKLGLYIRTVGENPAAADSAGIKVDLIRYLCAIFGGFLCGMAGAFLTIAYNNWWTEDISQGIGWIAIALVIFSGWKPVVAIWGAYLFGWFKAFQPRGQTIGIPLSPYILDLFPYLFAIGFLVLMMGIDKGRRRFGAPAALGVPYLREDKI